MLNLHTVRVEYINNKFFYKQASIIIHLLLTVSTIWL